MSVECGKCGAACGDKAKFCNSCGNKLVAGCPKCGAPLQPGDKFCGGCGAPMSGESPKTPQAQELTYDGPWRLTDTLKEWMDAEKWTDEIEFDREAGTSMVIFKYKPDEYPLRCVFEINEKLELFKFYMYCVDIEIPPNRMGEADKLVDRANTETILGTSQIVMNDDNGVFRYRNAIDVEDASFEPQHIVNMLTNGANFMNERIPQLQAIIKGKSADAVLGDK